uniref:Caffeoyl-CoA O-methyltransferase n=1 Tax=Chenopodium quinoa TaxID=63459 RepID=A0A803MAG8_CHEQI
MKQNKLDKINVLRTEAEANESIPGNHDTSKPPVYEESRQNVDIEQAGTKNHTIKDKSSQRLKKVTTLTPADKDDNKVSTVIEDQREKLIPGEVQIMHQITEKDVQEECDNNSCNQQQKHQEPIKMVLAVDPNREAYEVGLTSIKKAGVEHKIDFVQGSAMPFLNDLISKGKEGCFDFAFVDTDKENYINYHEPLLNLVKVGGVIAFDNTLWFGSVAIASDDEIFKNDPVMKYVKQNGYDAIKNASN